MIEHAWRDQIPRQLTPADRPLSVLIVTSEAPPIVSGISRCVDRLASGLTDRQHHVKVISSVQVPRLTLGEWRFSSLVAHWPRIARDLHNFDIVNLHGPAPTMSDAFLAMWRWLPARLRPAIVYTYHSPVDIPQVRRLSGWYDDLHRKLALRADRIIASSPHYAREHYKRDGPPVHAIPWGTDPREMPIGDQPRDRAGLRVLFVGQMRPYKGVQTLLAAAAGQPWLQLTLVGTGPELPAYQRLAQRLSASNVRFTGRLSDAELHACYASHDVVVLPSLTRAEAFGLVLLEGMSARCVPVASDWPGVRDVAGPTGLLVPPGDSNALRSALLALAEDPAQLERLRSASRRRAQALTWERCVSAYEHVMREAVRGRQARLRDLPIRPDRGHQEDRRAAPSMSAEGRE